MQKDSKKIYCSLDIETSGFDPLKNEILEVGFVMFEISESASQRVGKQIKIIEEWTQVFCPSKEVSPQVLALTGITRKELDEAPKFSEFHRFLQEKLGQAVIVGHNINFDIRFLESFGLKFSGLTIDTLDLAQWLLPTHHSYNLENLMHYFGIKHREAHRALADSKATLKLLESLLGIFSGLPKDLKDKIVKICEQQKFLFSEFLYLDFKTKVLPKVSPKLAAENSYNFKFEAQKIFDFPFGSKYYQNIVKSLASSRSKSLLVLPKPGEILELWKNKQISGAEFLPEWEFDEKKFQSLLKKKEQTADEAKFILKILVWQATNWQNRVLFDLNLSFFGGQFRGLVNKSAFGPESSDKVIGVDQQTFLQLSQKGLYRNRNTVVVGLNEFEQTISSDLGTKSSWGYVSFLLKSFYNPEIGQGEEKYKQAVIDGLTATDLFFGLANALLKSETEGFAYFRVDENSIHDEGFNKVAAASENYLNKLEKINQELESKEIKEFVINLKEFFNESANRVRWVELSENRCSFVSMPINISELVEKLVGVYENLCFADSLNSQKLNDYFSFRLGLEAFQRKQVAQADGKKTESKKIKQGDLFSGFKNLLGKSGKIKLFVVSQALTGDNLHPLIKNSNLPEAVLFPSSVFAREYYEQNYQELKNKAAVLSQSGSGGSNKILRNFSINPKSLLLVTDKFVLKQLNNDSQANPVKNLSVKTLIVGRLPFEQFTHPYQDAVSKSFNNAFMDFTLPRALFNLRSILRFFYTRELKEVYLFDPKLSKDYSKVFIEYLEKLPEFEIKMLN